MSIPLISSDDLAPYYGPQTERAIWNSGRQYIFRDVFENGIFQNCQYATQGAGGSKVWHDCREGSLFEEVEPYMVIHG